MIKIVLDIWTIISKIKRTWPPYFSGLSVRLERFQNCTILLLKMDDLHISSPEGECIWKT